MTKKEFRESHHYCVSETTKCCAFCSYFKISDRPACFVRFPAGTGDYYPQYRILCTRMGRKITTGLGCVCDLFESRGFT